MKINHVFGTVKNTHLKINHVFGTVKNTHLKINRVFGTVKKPNLELKPVRTPSTGIRSRKLPCLLRINRS